MRDFLATVTLVTAVSLLAILPALNYYEYVDMPHTIYVGVFSFMAGLAAYYVTK